MTPLFTFDDSLVNLFTQRLAEFETDYSPGVAVTAAQAKAAQRKSGQARMALGLAVSRIVRSQLTVHKTQLIEQAHPGYIKLSNGTTVKRLPDGCVAIERAPYALQYDPTLGTLVRDPLGKCSAYLGRVGSEIFGVAADLTAHATHTWVSAVSEAMAMKPLLNVIPATSLSDALWAAIEGLATHLSRNIWKESRKGAILGAAMWQHIWDKETFSITLKVFGKKASVAQYNHVAKNKGAWRAYCLETPNLVRMIGHSVTEALQAPEALGDGTAHRYGAAAPQLPDNMLQLLRSDFRAAGGTQSGWSFLTRQSSTVVGSIGYALVARSGGEPKNLAVLLNRLGTLGCPKLPAGHWLANLAFNAFNEALDPTALENRAKLVTLLAKAFHARKVKAKALLEVFRFTTDFLNNTAFKISTKTTFEGITRHQETWHRQLHQQQLLNAQRSQTQFFTWAPLVPEFVHLDVRLTSLNTSQELLAEGQAMQHCVGGYAVQCYQNACRIYHVERSGTHVSTLELRWLGNRWIVGQHYGWGNQKIQDKPVLAAAAKLLAACNRPSVRTLDPALNSVTSTLPEAIEPANDEFEQLAA